MTDTDTHPLARGIIRAAAGGRIDLYIGGSPDFTRTHGAAIKATGGRYERVAPGQGYRRITLPDAPGARRVASAALAAYPTDARSRVSRNGLSVSCSGADALRLGCSALVVRDAGERASRAPAAARVASLAEARAAVADWHAWHRELADERRAAVSAGADGGPDTWDGRRTIRLADEMEAALANALRDDGMIAISDAGSTLVLGGYGVEILFMAGEDWGTVFYSGWGVGGRVAGYTLDSRAELLRARIAKAEEVAAAALARAERARQRLAGVAAEMERRAAEKAAEGLAALSAAEPPTVSRYAPPAPPLAPLPAAAVARPLVGLGEVAS